MNRQIQDAIQSQPPSKENNERTNRTSQSQEVDKHLHHCYYQRPRSPHHNSILGHSLFQKPHPNAGKSHNNDRTSKRRDDLWIYDGRRPLVGTVAVSRCRRPVATTILGMDCGTDGQYPLALFDDGDLDKRCLQRHFTRGNDFLTVHTRRSVGDILFVEPSQAVSGVGTILKKNHLMGSVREGFRMRSPAIG